MPDDPAGVGYAGRETFNFVATGEARGFATTTTTHVRVRETDGSFLAIREVAHLTVSSAGLVVAFDRPTLTCS